jgi:hypothetical protein
MGIFFQTVRFVAALVTDILIKNVSCICGAILAAKTTVCSRL